MTSETRNMIAAVVLSLFVVVGWQYFIVTPQVERAAEQAEIAAQQSTDEGAVDLATPTATVGEAASTTPVAEQSTFATRQEAIASTERVRIETESLTGSINLAGGRIDDLSLKNYRETVDDESPIITLLTPASASGSFFVEQGWVVASGGNTKVPNGDTVWSVGPNRTLTATNPVVLTYDNGEGVVFTRSIEIDDKYLFTITQTVTNNSNGDIALFPYARVARYETPDVAGFFILHEGPIGVLGENNLIEKSYKDLRDDRQIDYEANGGWLGFTDKYWAAAVIPEPGTPVNARFSWNKPAENDIYQTSFVVRSPTVVAANGTANSKSYVFAGAKVEADIYKYENELGIDRFELMIDWGWFNFITRPMFIVIRWLFELTGNFGVAILLVTVMVKAIFFPLANKSYASMAAMRKVQPEIKALQEKFGDDRPGMQKAQMELFKREKINPVAGCWPMLIQIPVFFSLYKVLFVTIEMRQAPFFGWIQDLAARDPTNIFNLLGLLPYDPTAIPLIGTFLAIGIWPLIMGITMWVQMQLNPPPTDPTQKMIFGLMPIIFTFMLGTFPAGLVIYWAWNNFLGVIQQYYIMRRHGVDVNLLENITNIFKRKKADGDKPAS
ncbi:Inner membrane protein translocase and chaperone YidC, long form [hydrothermal vent metagenome]|uniref:Membrane protein insertase YidC n=1 Tax=hydrothermal vent metagenome TaxID=652676 RepID=A0A3B0TLH5_9ZZZZ